MTACASPWPRLAAALLIALGAACARAQAPTAAREAPWVQVELVVFRALDTALAGNETWPAPRGLAYPDPIRVLLEPGTPAHAAALAAREFDAVLAAEENAAAPGASAPELPFLQLAGPDTVLAASAARLAGSAQHRLLAHLAWRQPLPAPGSPVRVLVTAGQRTGEHFEVEGHLSLSRARYLHADTLLWLNDFPAAGAAAPAAGIVLPDVPLPRMPGAATTPPSFEGGTEPGTSPSDDPGYAAAATADALVVEPPRSLRTVTLSASRRVAPGEVHYLDHPLFGALLAVRPWDPAAGAPGAQDLVPAATPADAEETPPP